MKTHKRKKSTRYHGRKMGTCGRGSRTRARKSGTKGGVGMAGSGKRADQKRTLITKIFGNAYFGKQGFTSKGTERDKRKRINLLNIESNLENFIKKNIAKKSGQVFEIDLSDFKILGEGEVKNKLIIKALEASQSAIEKVEKAGGRIDVKKPKKIEKENSEEDGEEE